MGPAGSSVTLIQLSRGARARETPAADSRNERGQPWQAVGGQPHGWAGDADRRHDTPGVIEERRRGPPLEPERELLTVERVADRADLQELAAKIPGPVKVDAV